MKPVVVSVGSGVFTFRLVPTLITAAMLAVLLWLGCWQVQRLHWKENLISTIDQRTHLPPVDATTVLADADYRPATASGLFQYDKELYLTGMSIKGEGGYHILTPLQLEDGEYLLVDRGWVPYDRKDPDSRRDAQLAGPVTVNGLLRTPSPRSWMQPANNPGANSWYSIDLKAMADAVHIPAFMPFVLQADVTPNPGGYPVGGQTRLELPNNHLSYAITWFGLAIVLIIIYFVSSWKTARGGEVNRLV